MSVFKELIARWREEADLINLEGRAAKALRGLMFKDSALSNLELRLEEIKIKVGNAEDDYKKKKTGEELKEILWSLEDIISKNHNPVFKKDQDKMIFAVRLYCEYDQLNTILKDGNKKLSAKEVPLKSYFNTSVLMNERENYINQLLKLFDLKQYAEMGSYIFTLQEKSKLMKNLKLKTFLRALTTEAFTDNVYVQINKKYNEEKENYLEN